MFVPRALTDFEPQLVLLLHGDPNDAVARALISGRAKLGWPLVAVSTRQLLDGSSLEDAGTLAGRRVEPRHTAVINRLPLADRLEPGPSTAAGAMARQAAWRRLHDELGRFGYASSLPTATSILGCYGSLLDQWQDLPQLVPGLRVPDHSAPSLPRPLRGGAVFAVNRWTPYSLGKPLAEALAAGLPAAARLDYVMPEGRLVHLAQVGEAMFFPNPPPTMTTHQQQAMVEAARTLAAVSPIRILEHAFFVGNGAPVLYSSFPVPVLSGGHALYPELVTQGLHNDIKQWGGNKREADTRVDTVLRELRFGAVRPAASAVSHGSTAAADVARFRFAMDFDSPERWPDVPYDTAAPSARHADAIRPRIVSVLDDAARTMGERAPAALRLVDSQLQRVLLRASENAPGGSASHRAHVGCCLLTNLHQPADAALVAIEAVTHEAVHQLIYRREQAGGNFCDLGETLTLRSPWSGARLPLHSLVHACFVWFGLLGLWCELARAPTSDDESAHSRGRIAHCLFGFAFLDDLLDSPAFPEAGVDPQVLMAIRKMSAAARRAARAAEPRMPLRQVASICQDADWPTALAVSLASDEA